MYSLRSVAIIPACLTIVSAATPAFAQTDSSAEGQRTDAHQASAPDPAIAPSPNGANNSSAESTKEQSSSNDGELEVEAKPPSTPSDSATTAPESLNSPPATAVGAAHDANVPIQGAAASLAPESGRQATSGAATDEESKRLVDINGYGQFQYEAHKDSEDQLRQGGTLLNQDRFSVRRLRIELSKRFSYSGYLVEIDGNTTNGPALALMRAEGSLFYQGNAKEQPALIELTVGQLKVPFGYETTESSRTRWFMERTTASRAFFPAEVDVGARVAGAWRFLRYAVALTNGEPKGTKANAFQLQDPNHAKDFVMRIGADARPSERIQLVGGVTYLAGKGFSSGQDATKSRILWNDTDQDGKVSATELSGVPGTAAIPAHNFRRWAVGGDLRLSARSPLGWTTLFGEAVAAVNLDRGLYVADPVLTTYDLREWGWHAGVMQEVTQYALIGFRFDNYDPDSDLLDKRGGQFLPNNQAIATYSPLVGVTMPERARLIFQYDFVRDHLARDRVGTPTDLANNQWTLRLQVKL